MEESRPPTSDRSQRENGECPPFRELNQWLEGRSELADEQIAHIEQCSRCCDMLSALTDDEELRLWDSGIIAGDAETFREEPELRELQSALSDLSDQVDEVTAGGFGSTLSTDGALEDTAGEAATEAWTVETIEAALPSGRFSVERLIGVGGAGAVYLAFDNQLAREVAIKVLSRRSMRDRQRFVRETKLLAEIEHPNVVRIYDAGELSDTIAAEESRAPLYLVMEHLRGGPSTTLAHGQPIWSRAESSSLTFEKLATLIASAADGVSAAHARNFIHRDIKPGNLLLDEAGSTLKVADFGLARVADQEAAPITRTGDILGTPAFMSPEQVQDAGVVDASSDIYSLGATLYQLLTGEPPFQGPAAAVLRQVSDATPIRPRLLNPRIPTDLETICLHAMDREKSDRYASMTEFAEDLRRFAQGRPIHARPISAWQQASRLLRANPQFATALFISVLLAAVLLVGSVAVAVTLRMKNTELANAVDGERAAKQSAEAALQKSIEAGEALLLSVATETEFLPRTAGSQEVIETLLARARDYYQEFLDANKNNPTLAFQLARAHAGLAEVAMRVGDPQTLEQETLAALELLDNLPSDSDVPPADVARVRTDAIVVWGNYLTESGEAVQSVPLLKQAIESCRSAWSEPPPERLDNSYSSAALALAIAHTWVGEPEEAMALLAEARDRYANLHEAHPDEPRYLRNLAVCDMTLASTAIDQGKPVEGKAFLVRARELLNEVDEKDAIALRIRELKTKMLTNMALAERRLGNNQEAATVYAEAINETQRLIELEPIVPSHKWNLVVASMNSGGPELALGNKQQLVDRWRATLPQLDSLIRDEPENQRYQQVQAMLQSNIAIILRDLGKLDEAIEPLKAATLILQKQAEQLQFAAESYLPVALNHFELANTYLQLERWSDALDALDASDAIVDKILERQADFTPALGHRLDGLLARFEVHARSGLKLELLGPVVEEAAELSQLLRVENPEVAEYAVKAPRALLNLGQRERYEGRLKMALVHAREAASLAEIAAAATDETVVRDLRKDAAMLEIGLLKDQLADGDDPELVEQLQAAREAAKGFGANADEIEEGLAAIRASK